uniref:RING-type domain-containing protein n=1 Tax=Leersia perrieri TaxID=77586 RepID=A0A0D9X1Q0_9ORYZ
MAAAGSGERRVPPIMAEKVVVEKKGEGAAAATVSEAVESLVKAVSAAAEKLVEKAVSEAVKKAAAEAEAAKREEEEIGTMITLKSKDGEPVKYCDEHGNNKPDTDEEREKLEDFDKGFFDELAKDKGSLLNVILAANHLKIGGLLDLICQCAADRIKRGNTDGGIEGRTIPIEEIRDAFTINNEGDEEKQRDGLQLQSTATTAGEDQSCCVVCTEPLEWVAVGPCRHRVVCSSCMTYTRFVNRDMLCCLCRTHCPNVIVVKGDCEHGADILAELIPSSTAKSGSVADSLIWYHAETAAYYKKKGEGAEAPEMEKLTEKAASEEVKNAAVSKTMDGLVEKLMEDAVRESVSEKVTERMGEMVEEVVEKVLRKEVTRAFMAMGSVAVQRKLQAAAEKREEEERGLITLKSSDGDTFDVTEASARQSELIDRRHDRRRREDPCIPLTSIRSGTLVKLIEYCDEHGNSKCDTDEGRQELEEFDEAFIKEVAEDRKFLLQLLLAANYLRIRGLLDLIMAAYMLEDAAAGENATRSGEEKEKVVVPEAGKREEKGSGGRITLKSNEEKLFEVTEASARQSNFIAGMIDDDCADSAIPLPNVDSETLELVIAYCDKHGNSKSATDEEKEKLEEFDAAFVSELGKDKDSFFAVINAAIYLNIPGLIDLTTQHAADMIKGMTPEEMRVAFNIENDLTPEDLEEIRLEDSWAF